MMMRYVALAYALLSIFALLMVPASLYEWFGMDQDPLSGVFALILGLPWTLILQILPATGPYFPLLFAAIGMAINTAFLYWLESLFDRR